MSAPIDPVIAAWQTDNHEIGMVAFSPTEAATERFSYYSLPGDVTFVGMMEADALCVQPDDSLSVFDHESQNRIICPAAHNQRRFVDAMKELERHLDRCAVDDSYCDDTDAAATVRDRCAEMAGGEVYLAFFTSMVGV